MGRFSIPKNHKFLIDIFRQIYTQNSNAVLLLAGEGVLMDEIKQKVKECQLEHAVKFLGLRDDVERILQAMDVFVFPSLYEGLPVTLVEAQAVGIPCVVSSEITKEISIASNIKFLPLSQSAEKWAGECLKNNQKEKNTCNLIKSAGFDIKKNAEWLIEQYQRKLGGIR